MKHCPNPNCHSDNPDDAKYCHMCGRKFENETNGWKTAAIISLIILFILGVLVLYFNSKIDSLESNCRYYQNEFNQKSTTINELEVKMTKYQSAINELEAQVTNYQSTKDTIRQLKKQVEEKDEEITRLNNSYNDYYYYKNRVYDLNRQIENLQSQLPKTYYTRYAEQYVYNKCGGNYEKSSCYFPKKGSSITIYTTSDGYGLIHTGGWIPMNCLQK